MTQTIWNLHSSTRSIQVSCQWPRVSLPSKELYRNCYFILPSVWSFNSAVWSPCLSVWPDPHSHLYFSKTVDRHYSIFLSSSIPVVIFLIFKSASWQRLSRTFSSFFFSFYSINYWFPILSWTLSSTTLVAIFCWVRTKFSKCTLNLKFHAEVWSTRELYNKQLAPNIVSHLSVGLCNNVKFFSFKPRNRNFLF